MDPCPTHSGMEVRVKGLEDQLLPVDLDRHGQKSEGEKYP